MKRILPWLTCGLSLGLLASQVALQRVELPFTLDNQRSQLLLMIGAAVWPAVLAPWLQYVPKRGRLACAWLVPLAGYALLG